jgi:glucose-6-phosphate 1-dehydrogenase
MVEKPFGNSLASSEKLFEIIKKYFNDEQVYKIDHYLFKTLLQNINNFKNENEILSKIWNDTYIHSIYVEAYEEIDIQGRSEFYEQTGLLRDFIQSHLMETLILTIAKNDSIEERNKVIDSILPIKDLSLVKRSQYIGYKYEVNNPNSNVETFCEVVLKSNDNN